MWDDSINPGTERRRTVPEIIYRILRLFIYSFIHLFQIPHSAREGLRVGEGQTKKKLYIKTPKKKDERNKCPKNSLKKQLKKTTVSVVFLLNREKRMNPGWQKVQFHWKMQNKTMTTEIVAFGSPRPGVN